MATTLTIDITEELQLQAKAIADMRGETLSDVVRSALEEYIESTTQQDYDAKWALKNDPLFSLRFSGGPGDVAERVDEILNDASDVNSGLRVDDDRPD